MSDNWIVQNLNSALSTWSEKMAELWTLLTENPATFKGGGIWRIMTNINDALTAIAYGLLVLFFAAGIIKTCGSFTDLKKPEHVLKAFIRFALAQGAITYGMELMQALFSIVQGIVTTVMSGSGMAGSVTELPTEIVDKIESVGMLESIPLWIVTLLGSLLITVLSFVMILTVYAGCSRSICIPQSPRSQSPLLQENLHNPSERTFSVLMWVCVWKGRSLHWHVSSIPPMPQALRQWGVQS